VAWGYRSGEDIVTRRIRQLLATTAATSLVIWGVVGIGAQSASAIGVTRFVAKTGSDAAANTCLVSASPCLTLGHALGQAAAGDTIQLDPGTYLVSDDPSGTSNAVPTTLHDLTIKSNLSGGTAANTIIDATGEANGLVVNASGVTVKNLTFKNADLQGILVTPPDDATTPAAVLNLDLTGNVVTNNDQCSKHPAASDCPPASPNDDFGEAIQLLSVIDSTVDSNTVTGNFGGILLTDEMGPNHGNTISDNTVNNNAGDCGITLASHNPNAVALSGANAGKPQPTLAGVYDNTISGNTANGNGAAGIIMAGPISGTAAYGNTVTDNTANDNGIAGISIHSHALGQDMNGNVITGNHVSHDALTGGAGGGPGDSDAGDVHTTGILVLASVQQVSGTVITGNTISNVFYGVWLSKAVTKPNVSGNTTSFDSGGAAIFVNRLLKTPSVGIARTPSGHGYWVADSNGAVSPFGDAGYFGSVDGVGLTQPIVGIASTPTGLGYWLVAADGGIFSFGDAQFFGSTGAMHLNQPIVGMAAGPGGTGYWLVAADGGIFSFGSAQFHGSTGAMHLNQPVVGMAAGPGGTGYWLDASDGGIFSFGTATFHGSTGAMHLNQPVVGMTSEPGGNGYWLVASDGGIFSFGTATFHGSTGAIHLNQPIVGMAVTPTGLGYWLVASDGGIFAFPDAQYFGSVPANIAND
jgi:parallel beta-helix repeat protein